MWHIISNILVVYIIVINIITLPVIFWIYANAEYLEKTGEEDNELDTIDTIAFIILIANPIIELVLLYFYIKDNYA